MKKGDRWPRTEQIADMLQVQPEVVIELIRTGQLRALRLPGGELRVDPRSLQDFLLACELDLRKHFVGVLP